MTKLVFLIALCLHDQHGVTTVHLVFTRFRAAHTDPTASTRSNRDINHRSPCCNNTAKLPQNNWTFNKTLSKLIRQAHHSPQILKLSFSNSTKCSLSKVYFFVVAGRISWDFSIRRETSPSWRAHWSRGISSTMSLIATAPQTSQRISTVSCQPCPQWRTSTTGAAPSWETPASYWTAAVGPRSTLMTLLSGVFSSFPFCT